MGHNLIEVHELKIRDGMTPTPNPTTLKFAFLRPLLVIALVFGLVGCYTILKHPVTSQEGPEHGEQVEHTPDYYRQNCLDCHADFATYPYGYFYGTYPEYYFEYPRWGYYYAYPWWWDNQWYDEVPDDEDHEETRGARAGRRGALAPPYSYGAPAVRSRPTHIGIGYRSTSMPADPGKNTGGNSGPTGSGGNRGDKKRVYKSSETDDDDAKSKVTTETRGKKSKRRGSAPPR